MGNMGNEKDQGKESEFVKLTISIQRRTLPKLKAVTKARHGRVDRFMSATIDQMIIDAFSQLPDDQKKVSESEDDDTTQN